MTHLKIHNIRKELEKASSSADYQDSLDDIKKISDDLLEALRTPIVHELEDAHSHLSAYLDQDFGKNEDKKKKDAAVKSLEIAYNLCKSLAKEVKNSK